MSVLEGKADFRRGHRLPRTNFVDMTAACMLPSNNKNPSDFVMKVRRQVMHKCPFPAVALCDVAAIRIPSGAGSHIAGGATALDAEIVHRVPKNDRNVWGINVTGSTGA